MSDNTEVKKETAKPVSAKVKKETVRRYEAWKNANSNLLILSGRGGK